MIQLYVYNITIMLLFNIRYGLILENIFSQGSIKILLKGEPQIIKDKNNQCSCGSVLLTINMATFKKSRN